jgi:hypothetical protein
VGGQGLVAEWLAKGGTVGVGNVYEPSSGSCYEANEDQMFKMLLNGYTWGEAAWSSLQQLSYVNTVVGDPLMTWKVAAVGDFNLDGVVDDRDRDIWFENAGTGTTWQQGDANGDGVVDGLDFDLWLSSSAQSPLGGDGVVGASAPEPGTLVMLAAGLLVYVWRKRFAA